MALEDVEHRVLADAEPVTDLPIRLAGADQLQDLRGTAVRLDPLPQAATEYHVTPAGCGDPGVHPLAQQVAFELGERGHQGSDEFALRAAKVELQSNPGDEGPCRSWRTWNRSSIERPSA